MIVNEITEPLKENGEPHRPEEIVFDEQKYVDDLAPSLAALGIYCKQLFAPDGVPEYVQKVSDIFLKEMEGGVNYSNTLPGLTSITNVGRDQLNGFYSAAFDFFNEKPWENVGDRQAFCLRAKDFRLKTGLLIEGGHVFVSILGRDGGPRGIAMFYNQTELENRAKPEGGEIIILPRSRICSNCGKSGLEIGSELKRCTRCKTVYYCDATCQKSHWKKHKLECVTMDNHPKVDNVIWGFRETSVIFQQETELSFADLEDMDDNKYIPPTNDSYPFPITYRKGEATRPTASELLWCERALRAAIICGKPTCKVCEPNNVASGIYPFYIKLGKPEKEESIDLINTCVLVRADLKQRNDDDDDEKDKTNDIDEKEAEKTEKEVNEID